MNHENQKQDVPNKAPQATKKRWIDALLIGVLVGISLYSVIKKGFGFFTFLPLFFVYIVIKNSKKKE